MVWAKLDDGILDNPKVASVGPIGFALYAASLVYANRNLTDGFIPFTASRRLLPLETVDDNGVIWTLAQTSGMSGEDGVDCVDRAIGWLLDANLWEDADGGYLVHDFGEWNRTKGEVLLQREELSAIRSKAGKLGADARWHGNDIATPKQEVGQSDDPVPVPVPVPVPKGQSQTPSLASEDEFEKFWKAAPSRGSKIEAKKAYVKARKTVDADVLLDAVVAYAKQVTVKGKSVEYIKHTSGWLNGGYWTAVEPEPPEPHGPTIRPYDPDEDL